MVSETEPQFCTVANRNTCGPTYWCHFGAVAQTTLCCPGKGLTWCVFCIEVVAMKSHSKIHWKQTKFFSGLLYAYKGPRFRDSMGFHPNCDHGPISSRTHRSGTRDLDPLDPYGSQRSWQLFHQSNSLKILIFCMCVPILVEGQAICQQPMSMGSGESSLQRWYYDSINKCCVQFVYKGRYGNQNNFLTRQECEQTCIG